MFELNYRVVYSEYDDFIGQNGYFQIKCNGFIYGEMYPKELDNIMDKVSLYDWFERLIRVIKNLSTHEYVVLSDVESYNVWIEFQRSKEEVMISIVKAEKEKDSSDIMLELRGKVDGEWKNQEVSYDQVRKEIIEKTAEYIRYLVANNIENEKINKIKKKFAEIL